MRKGLPYALLRLLRPKEARVDIGEIIEVITVEPVEPPIPRENPQPEPVPPAPIREPERVGARL